MLSFNDIADGIKDFEGTTEEYFRKTFTPENYRQYAVDYELTSLQKKAIKTMFESKKDLDKRIDQALKSDPFCLEAFFAYFVLSDDVFVNYRFETYYAQSENYADFDVYEKYCYITIMDFYVEFLLDIKNITRAIKVQRMIIRLTNDHSKTAIDRLAFMYNIIEDSDEFYRLYLDNEFDEYDYLLLMVTLLKNDEQIKAREVLDDMFRNIEYSDYMDHLWDLDLDDPKQKEFYDVIEDCFQDISAIPDFFTWVNFAKENGKE